MSLSYDTEDRICMNSHYQSKGDKKGWFGFLGFFSGFNQTQFMLSKCQEPASAQRLNLLPLACLLLNTPFSVVLFSAV